MSEQPIETQFFRTIEDFVALPAEKIAHCLKDFELWLTAIKIAEANSQRITTPTHEFGWLDDGKHHIKVQINGLDMDSLRQNHQVDVDEIADALMDRLVKRLSRKQHKGGRPA